LRFAVQRLPHIGNPDGLALRLTGPHNEADGCRVRGRGVPLIIRGLQAIAGLTFAIELTTHLEPNQVNGRSLP
jgi:hypothetical protein